MKFLPLVWAGLWRRPVRSTLTALCIVIAFVLLGLLEGVNAGFARAIANAHREFLITNTRVRGSPPMPMSALAILRSMRGIAEAAPRAYFVANYRDPSPNSSVVLLATYPDLFFHLTAAGLKVTPSAVAALVHTRNGMLVTPPMLTQFGWKVGDTIPLQTTAVKTDGTTTWTFELLGTFDTPNSPTPSYFGVMNYDYFNDSRTADHDTAELFYVRLKDPTRATAMAAAIDTAFANSSHETRTRSQEQRAQAQAKQMGDVELFTDAVIGAVLFTLAFLTGNSLRQALEERAREFGILKSVGYSDGRVLLLAFAEALLLCLPAAALGLIIARLIAPLAREDIGSIVVSGRVAAAGLLCAAGLAFLGAALPASRVARMPITAALGRG
ncbi:MAG TPA: ABC transporter permease [Steroidobacteraceae bacterium]|jgi:putative ABC transport system permease protein|nr:ABC transporter permease [Steroidobacteraceae bacterium]